MKKLGIISIGVLIATNTMAGTYIYHIRNNTNQLPFQITIEQNKCSISPSNFLLAPHADQQISIENEDNKTECLITIMAWASSISEGDNTSIRMTLNPQYYENYQYNCTKIPMGKLYLCKDNSVNYSHPAYITTYNTDMLAYYDSIK